MQRGLALFFKFEHGSRFSAFSSKTVKPAPLHRARRSVRPRSPSPRERDANSTGARPPKDRGSYGAC